MLKITFFGEQERKRYQEKLWKLFITGKTRAQSALVCSLGVSSSFSYGTAWSDRVTVVTQMILVHQSTHCVEKQLVIATRYSPLLLWFVLYFSACTCVFTFSFSLEAVLTSNFFPFL